MTGTGDEAGSGGQAPPSFGGADGGPYWPGVARPAGWFLQVPRNPTPSAPSPEPARPDPTQAADDVADSADWDEAIDPVTWEADVPLAPDQASWYQDPDDTGAPAPEPEPAVGPTSALRGRPGGPGFAVPPGMVAGLYDPARRSGWQQAQGLWRGSGVHWERPFVPVTEPRPQQQPQPPQRQPQQQPQPQRPQPHPQQPSRNPSASAPPRRPAPRQAAGNGASAPTAFGTGRPPLGAPTYVDAPPGRRPETGELDDPYRTWRDEPETGWPPPKLTEYPELSPVRVRRGPRRRHTGLRVLRVGLPVLVIVVVGVGAVMLLTGRTNLQLAARGSRAAGTTGASAPSTVGEPSASGTVTPVTFPGYPGKGAERLTVSSLSAAGGEQVAAGSAGGYPAIWRRGSGGSWSLASGAASDALSGRPGAEAMTAVTHGPAGWLAVGDVVSGAPQHAVVVTSGDGATWRAADGEPAFSGSGEYAYGAAAGRSGYVIVGKRMYGNRTYAAVWWSASPGDWTRGDNGGLDGRLVPSEMLAVTAVPDGFVAVGAHGSGPAVWTSGDGQHWTVMNVPAPAGAKSAVIGQVAANGTRVVAAGDAVTGTGTAPFAEVSADGGARWQEVALPATGGQARVTALAASGAGFTAAGTSGQAAVAWTSADGTTWTSARPLGGGVQEITALAPAGDTVTGVGFTTAQLGARPILWTSPAS